MERVRPDPHEERVSLAQDLAERTAKRAGDYLVGIRDSFRFPKLLQDHHRLAPALWLAKSADEAIPLVTELVENYWRLLKEEGFSREGYERELEQYLKGLIRDSIRNALLRRPGHHLGRSRTFGADLRPQLPSHCPGSWPGVGATSPWSSKRRERNRSPLFPI
ncbi:MAG: hypothetical protein NTV14_09535 [Coprothermobacterota bacterium]|nr:hypothetical protein [Coprothermobacterota bacterium]